MTKEVYISVAQNEIGTRITTESRDKKVEVYESIDKALSEKTIQKRKALVGIIGSRITYLSASGAAIGYSIIELAQNNSNPDFIRNFVAGLTVAGISFLAEQKFEDRYIEAKQTISKIHSQYGFSGF